MIRRFLISGLSLGLLFGLPGKAGARTAPEPVVRHLAKVNLLPLALDDSFSFRKKQLFTNDPLLNKPTHDQTIAFERQRLNYKAVTAEEKKARYGEYFAFWWRTARRAKLTVRLEYRQAGLGAYVQAKEIDVAAEKGTHETKFQVTGDDYNEDGRITAWRAVLIENGKIVALTQSFLWH